MFKLYSDAIYNVVGNFEKNQILTQILAQILNQMTRSYRVYWRLFYAIFILCYWYFYLYIKLCCLRYWLKYGLSLIDRSTDWKNNRARNLMSRIFVILHVVRVSKGIFSEGYFDPSDVEVVRQTCYYFCIIEKNFQIPLEIS